MTDMDTLRDAAVAALKAANTLAGQRVYSPRDWPTWNGIHPAIIVRTPNESAQSLGPVGVPTFNTTITLTISGRTERDSEAHADADARTLAQQIKSAILQNGQFIKTQAVQQFVGFTSRIEVTAEGRQHIGDVTVSFSIEVFQVYEPTIDAAGDPIGTPLTNVRIHIDAIEPFDASGTYANAAFPDAVTPAPRQSGPDGRDEGALTLTLPQ